MKYRVSLDDKSQGFDIVFDLPCKPSRGEILYLDSAITGYKTDLCFIKNIGYDKDEPDICTLSLVENIEDTIDHRNIEAIKTKMDILNARIELEFARLSLRIDENDQAMINLTKQLKEQNAEYLNEVLSVMGLMDRSTRDVTSHLHEMKYLLDVKVASQMEENASRIRGHLSDIESRLTRY